jgi:hypothetical protein
VSAAAVACCLAVILLVSSSPALASPPTVHDGNDVEGLLDIETVVFWADQGPYSWVFSTFAGWTARRIWDLGYFVVELDTVGDDAADYVVVLRSDGHGMAGDLFRRRADGDEVHVRKLDTWRAGRRAAGVAVPRWSLWYGSSRTTFGWRTLSLFVGDRCRSSCIDRAPDDGTFVEEKVPAG